jgi:adenosylhomocysteine nucleosidase
MVSHPQLRAEHMTSTPKPRPVFIAALRREIAAVVKGNGWHEDHSKHSRHIHMYVHEDAIVACAGMGAARASLAIEAALALGPASELISVGFAGACEPQFHVGDVIHPSILIDARTGERFFLADPSTTDAAEIVVTVATPADALAKQRLAISYSASAVDMEAAAVARIAQAHGLPFSAIKAISDEADFELPDMQQFSTDDGQFQESEFGLFIAFRPWMWKSVLIMARGSKLAAQRLRAEIEAHIQEHRGQKS